MGSPNERPRSRPPTHRARPVRGRHEPAVSPRGSEAMARWRGRSGPNGRPPRLYPRRLPSLRVELGRAGADAGRPPPLHAGRDSGAPRGPGHPQSRALRCPCPCGGRVPVPPGRPRSQEGQPGQTCPERLGLSGCTAQLPVLLSPPSPSFRTPPFPRRAGGKGGNGGLSQLCPWSRKTGPGHLPARGCPSQASTRAASAVSSARVQGDL